MYCFDSRVRYSEIDGNGQLTIPDVINYFQDCSTFHSENLGLGVKWLLENSFCWVVNSWEIKIHRLPSLGETITIATWPYEMNGFLGLRNFTMQDESGRNIIEANSVWTYMDTKRLRPTKVDELSKERYILEPALERQWKGRKIPLPKQGDIKSPIPVVKYFLDTNGHVNNGKYILLAMEYLPDGFETEYIRVEYKRSAMPGDIMIPRVTSEDKRIVVSMENENGEAFAVIEFERGIIC